ncbi:MAG TPA: hypothetical protein VFU81_15780, partial [Thermomicrobiales bacterium]|nr:hypothetical protein [Thermomicrobiales bacterium]
MAGNMALLASWPVQTVAYGLATRALLGGLFRTERLPALECWGRLAAVPAVAFSIGVAFPSWRRALGAPLGLVAPVAMRVVQDERAGRLPPEFHAYWERAFAVALS